MKNSKQSPKKNERKKGKHKKVFEDRKRNERQWESKEMAWKPTPDAVVMSPNICPETKVIYWILWTLLPCSIRVKDLAITAQIRTNNASNAIQELLKRNLIYYKVEPGGSRKCIYGIVMDIKQWDLQSKSKGIWLEFEEDRKRKREEKKISVSQAETKKPIAFPLRKRKLKILFPLRKCNSNFRFRSGNAKAYYYDSNILKNDSTLKDITTNENGLALVGPSISLDNVKDLQQEALSEMWKFLS